MGLLTLNELAGLGQSTSSATITIKHHTATGEVMEIVPIRRIVNTDLRRERPSYRAAVMRVLRDPRVRAKIAAWERSRRAHVRAAAWARRRRERQAVAGRMARLAARPPRGRTSTGSKLNHYGYKNPAYKTMKAATGWTEADCRRGKFPRQAGRPVDYDPRSRKWWGAECERIYRVEFLRKLRASQRTKTPQGVASGPVVSAEGPWIDPRLADKRPVTGQLYARQARSGVPVRLASAELVQNYVSYRK